MAINVSQRYRQVRDPCMAPLKELTQSRGDAKGIKTGAHPSGGLPRDSGVCDIFFAFFVSWRETVPLSQQSQVSRQ